MKFICTLLVTCCAILCVNAQGYEINNYHVDIEVRQDGKMDITETIATNFLVEKRGIIRVIPFQYKLNGRKYLTPITNIKVKDFKTKITNEGPNKRIRIGSENIYLNGPNEYVISYTVDNAIVEYEDGQEIYWNLTGNSWDTEIKKLSYSIQLPNSVEIPDEFMRINTGKEGSEASDGTISKSNNMILGQVDQALNRSEGATVAIKLPSGYLDGLPQFDQLDTYGLDKEKNKPWFVVFPLLLLTLIRQWWYKLRNKNKVKKEIYPIAYPPAGLTSAHVGAYIDHKVDSRDVISLIPYWATEGFIKVQGTEDGDMVLFKQSDLPGDIPEYERDFFYEIFKNRDSITLSQAKNKFGMAYYKVKRKIVRELEGAGYYDSGYVKVFKTFAWPLICLAMIVGGILSIALAGYVIIGIGLIIVGLASIFLSLFTAPLSPFGQEIHDELKGLEMFMKDASEDEIKATLDKDPEYFGRMLPYAVAFGLDKQWLKTFDKIYDSAPFWYTGYGYGSGSRPSFKQFSDSFDVKEITRAFTYSEPAVSSGSGGSFSGGGGFSGGGFGGGGGSSW